MTSKPADRKSESRYRGWSRLWRCSAVSIACACLSLSNAATGQDLVAQVKAAFVFNFARFIEWPDVAFATEESPFWLCTYGGDTTALGIDQMKGRLVNDRQIHARQVKTVSDARNCHILFIDDKYASHEMAAMADLANEAILTISDAPWFVREGGMISLYTRGRHVRFSINQTSARGAGLLISGRLLQLAEEVR